MLNRSLAPPVNQLEDFHLPESEKVVAASGAKIFYLANSTQPVIRLEIVFPAGKWFEPAKGISYFVSKLLLEGTKTKSAKQIADILDFYGASLECNQGFDWATLTLYCLSKHYLALLNLVTEILNEATFPESEFALLKQRTIQNLQVERKKPAYLAMEAFTQNIYGKDHPYTSGLDADSINQLNLSEIIAFYKAYYSTEGAIIFLCGDITPEIKAATENIRINNAGQGTFSGPNHTIFEGPVSNQLKIKDSLQSAVRVGRLFPSINDEDYLKLTVVNKILGGYFGSRLMKNIREDKGFTYGIHSALSVRNNSTLFFIGTEIKVDKAEETLVEIAKEIKILQEAEITDHELYTVKNFMIGKFLNDSTTVFDQLDRLKHLILHNLPADHYSKYIQTVKDFLGQDLKLLSQKYLSGDLFTVYTTN